MQDNGAGRYAPSRHLLVYAQASGADRREAVICPDNGNEVLARAKQGDPEAFAELYVQYRHLVYRRCLQMLHDEPAAEDLTQEVFLKVWAHIGQFDGRSQFSTWLYRIATNAVLVYLRKTAPAFVYLDDNTAQFEIPNPSDTYRHVQLSEVLEKVRPQDEEVLGMWLDGRKIQDIAKSTGTNLSNVKSKIHRAKGALREALA